MDTSNKGGGLYPYFADADLAGFARNTRRSDILELPVVLRKSASNPVAVLLLPVVLLASALTPLAVFSLPVVFLKSALPPSAVLLKG